MILSDRDLAGLAGADTETFLEIKDEDLAVPNVIGPRAFDDRIDRGLYEFLVDGDLQFDLLEKPAAFLVAPINLGDPFLAPAAKNIGHGHKMNLFFFQDSQNFVQPVRLNDRDDITQG